MSREPAASASDVFLEIIDQHQHVARHLGAEFDFLARDRVDEGETTGMQCLTRELTQQLLERVTGPRRQLQTPAVDRVSDQRIALVRHVHANLVGTPGFQLAADMGVTPEALHYAEVGDRRLATVSDGLTLAVLGVTPDGRIHGGAGGQHARDDGIVLARHGTGLQLLDQVRLGGQ